MKRIYKVKKILYYFILIYVMLLCVLMITNYLEVKRMKNIINTHLVDDTYSIVTISELGEGNWDSLKIDLIFSVSIFNISRSNFDYFHGFAQTIITSAFHFRHDSEFSRNHPYDEYLYKNHKLLFIKRYDSFLFERIDDAGEYLCKVFTKNRNIPKAKIISTQDLMTLFDWDLLEISSYYSDGYRGNIFIFTNENKCVKEIVLPVDLVYVQYEIGYSSITLKKNDFVFISKGLNSSYTSLAVQ